MGGFVYIWYDRKKKRFYIGSHWGEEDDGYVCSSTWMKQAYKNRKDDFRREILARVTTSRDDLLKEEQRWLDMIKPEELKKRYYNLYLGSGRRWHTDPDSILTIGQKISKANRGRKLSPEWRKKLGDALRGGTISEAQKVQIADTLSGKKHTEERRKNQSEAGKNRKRACCVACRKEMNVSALFHWHEGRCR